MRSLRTLHTVMRVALPIATWIGVFEMPAAAQPRKIEFPPAYIAAHRGENAYVVSPALELANILVAVAFRDADIQYHPLRRKPAYYAAVLAHFSPYASHPVFARLGLDPNDLSTYTTLRNSSYRWRPCGNQWCQEEFLGRWWSGDKLDPFAENIELIADFARQSGFQSFYEDHRPYYERLIKLYEARVDLDGMIDWLSSHFPGRYDAYTVLFSPLILGNQATTRKVGNDFGQVFMIVDPPAETEDLTRALNTAKWVFTELDHQFVNPESDRYAEQIEPIFRQRDIWTGEKQSRGYRSALSVFNEYMTWAVYVVYIDDHFDEPVATAHTAAVITFMEGQRGFPRFGEFVATLRSLRAGSDQPISKLYPELLRWAEKRMKPRAAK